MSRKPNISIIIPVYGVEKFIAKCVNSIKNQVYTDYEVLLINDGTNDSSIVIAEEAIAEDDRFFILHKKNGGQGSARNLGIDNARGDFITFIDSDDYVEPRFLQAMYEKVVEDAADVCTCNTLFKSVDGDVVKRHYNNASKYLDESDYLNSRNYISSFFCDKLFRATLFDDLRFDESVKTYEDAHLLFRVVYGRKITQVDEFLYNYIQHKGSTSHSLRPTFIKDRMAVMDARLSFAEEKGIDDNDYITYSYLKTFVLFCGFYIAKYSTEYREDVSKLKRELDPVKFSYKNVLLMGSKDKRGSLALLIFKVSPCLFRLFVLFWSRNRPA